MEYNFRVTELFPKEVSIVGSDLIPLNCPGLPHLGPQTVRDRMSQILETMGRASAEAQQLHSVITNTEKLRTSVDQKIYFMCDFSSNQVIGLLKIGKKKLFMFDLSGTQHEFSPMCILDFYVHESRQRQGCGKYLFENVMREEGIPVEHFAIDRPSDKLLNFLRKHYNLAKIIPQVNNFVIFDGFFNSRSDYAGKKNRWRGLDQDQTPDRQRASTFTILEDSSDYNNQPGIHLRNGQSHIPNFVPHRHNTTIGEVLQPSQNGSHDHHHPDRISSYARHM
ncbi:Alpha-tubulin N-acetyltransferase 1 [Orchesella cincta]|uniref:Alpha-tubulin N-acetyltransferase n=1 Tax=Orchesella cincta TaxID=48709 RepID=A0A1D2MF82_ORCCI|nr:Alpha-tubulin N-acetyltransferase 1 [Orchesella cincta]